MNACAAGLPRAEGGGQSYSGYVLDPNMSGLAVMRGNNYGTSKRYDIVANETNLNLAFDTGHIHHDVVAGAEFYHERYGDLTRTVIGPATNPVMSLANSYGTNMGALPTVESGAGGYSAVTDGGVYLRDTVTLTPKWIVDGAIRYDRFSVKQVNGAANAHTVERSNDGAWSGRAGIAYKPVPFGSIYASYRQATQPSAVGGTTNNVIYGDTTSQSVKPATAKTWEVGTKWDLFDRRLSLTGALFHTELSDSWDYGDSTTTVVRQLPPKRVDGIELGVSGDITDKWPAFAGFAGMRGRITKGANEGAPRQRAEHHVQSVDLVPGHAEVRRQLRRAVCRHAPLHRQRLRRRPEQPQQHGERRERQASGVRDRQRDGPGVLAALAANGWSISFVAMCMRCSRLRCASPSPGSSSSNSAELEITINGVRSSWPTSAVNSRSRCNAASSWL